MGRVVSILFGAKPDWREGLAYRLAGSRFAHAMDPLGTADLGIFDGIVPLTLDDRRILAERCGRGDAAASLLPSAEAEALCHDKVALNTHLRVHGFGAHVPAMHENLPTAAQDYPVIIKRRRGEWGVGGRILLAPPDGPVAFDRATEFIQAYVPGAMEYATHILLKGGALLFAATVRHTLRASPYVMGASEQPVRSDWLEATPCLPLFLRMLATAGFRDGICCIDYRLVAGRPLVFEINPRFGASLGERIIPFLNAYVGALAGRPAAC